MEQEPTSSTNVHLRRAERAERIARGLDIVLSVGLCLGERSPLGYIRGEGTQVVANTADQDEELDEITGKAFAAYTDLNE